MQSWKCLIKVKKQYLEIDLKIESAQYPPPLPSSPAGQGSAQLLNQQEIKRFKLNFYWVFSNLL